MTVERDAAPAGWFRKPALGRPRPAVRPHYDGLPSMAGRAGHERRREPPGWRSPKGFSDAPTRKHGLRGQKSRWWRAERRRAFEKNARTKQYGRAAWRATPSIVRGAKREGGLPGASNNTGDDARLLHFTLQGRVERKRLLALPHPHRRLVSRACCRTPKTSTR